MANVSVKPLISVVLPVWNAQRWLAEAIDSIQCQTVGDFELVIVDDGSTDASVTIIQAKAQGDRRIRVFRQERLGLVTTLNRGISEARAQLIARIDADDRVYPQRLQKQIEHFDRHPNVFHDAIQ